MKRIDCCIILALLFLLTLHTNQLHAFVIYEDVPFASSPNPVGSGARASGMGGAFIAVADDATAASWNPGGLIQLETPELSLVMDYASRKEDYSSASDPEIDNSTSTSETSLNYFSASYPFHLLNRNMVLSINYQRLYNFKFQADYRFERVEPQSFPFESLTSSQDIDYRQKGHLAPLGLAYAVQITPRFSFGFTMNFWRDGTLGYANGWQETYNAHVEDTLLDAFGNTTTNVVNVHIEDEYTEFSGENVNLGILWNVTPFLSVGAVVKTPFTATIQHQHTRQDLPSENFKKGIELDMPLSYGLGVSLRFSDALTMGLDVYRTEWSKYMIEDGQGNRYSAVDGRPESESDIHDTTQVRVGCEYLLIDPDKNLVIPFRTGLFYDPEPMDGSVKDFYGFTLGSGIGFKGIIFDVAYQLRWGRNIDASNVIISSTGDVESDIIQHTLFGSVIYHF